MMTSRSCAPVASATALRYITPTAAVTSPGMTASHSRPRRISCTGTCCWTQPMAPTDSRVDLGAWMAAS